jgi:phage head maturation protease
VSGALGTLHGYACLWNVASRDLSADAEAHRFDIIVPRAITFAPDVRANVWHIRDTFFASTRDSSLEVFLDARGAGFSAKIPPTARGYDLLLRDGKSLGVSGEFCDVQATCDISAAAFPQLRV